MDVVPNLDQMDDADDLSNISDSLVKELPVIATEPCLKCTSLDQKFHCRHIFMVEDDPLAQCGAGSSTKGSVP